MVTEETTRSRYQNGRGSCSQVGLAIVIVCSVVGVSHGVPFEAHAGVDSPAQVGGDAAHPAMRNLTLDAEQSLFPASSQQATGLTFDQVINECLVNDPQIRAGLEAINQANADALTASLRPNPTLFTDIQLLPLTRHSPLRQCPSKKHARSRSRIGRIYLHCG